VVRRWGGAGRPRGSGSGLIGLAVIWAVSMIAFGIIGMPGDGGTQIAWVAHLGGFVAGLLLFRFFIRDGPTDDQT
jgi:membrane associated rhomboid family serine protease